MEDADTRKLNASDRRLSIKSAPAARQPVDASNANQVQIPSLDGLTGFFSDLAYKVRITMHAFTIN